MKKHIKFIAFVLTIVFLTACMQNPKGSEVFNPDSDLEDNYVWMEGIIKIKTFEEKDERYYVAVRPNENSANKYRTMIISFDKDVKITKKEKIISIDDFANVNDNSEVRFASYMDKNIGAELRTGVVTDIVLLEE